MRAASRYAGIAMVILFCMPMAILLVMSSGGSAHAWFETRDAKLQSVKTVGIISAIGDQFTFATAGLTSLDNSPRSGQISSWGLDDQMVQQVTEMLSARFQVQPLTYPRATFATTRESAITAVNLVRGDPFKKLVQTEVSPQGLDAYIVITKARAYFAGSYRKVEGVGLIRYRTILESFDLLHALYEIRVVDGKTFDIIEKLAAGPLDNAASVRLPGPSLVIDAGFDEQNDNLHRAVVDLVTRSLPNTLSDMHLINQKR